MVFSNTTLSNDYTAIHAIMHIGLIIYKNLFKIHPIRLKLLEEIFSKGGNSSVTYSFPGYLSMSLINTKT